MSSVPDDPLIESILIIAPFCQIVYRRIWAIESSMTTLNRPDEDSLRAMLKTQVKQKLLDDTEAVTIYAA